MQIPPEKKELMKEIKKYGKKLKNKYYGKKAQELNLASEARDAEEEFRLMKNYTALKNKKQLLISPQKLEEHFKDHFKHKPIEVPDEVTNPQNYQHLLLPPEITNARIDEEPPNAEELEKTTKMMKNGRCKDPSNIYAEQIKYNGSAKLISLIITLFTLIWSLATAPQAWLHSIIACLFKNKGDKMDPGNYRGLSITSTLSKLFTSIIINRLKPIYEAILLPSQFGFRANKSTNDAIFVLKNIIDNSSEELHCCFIDLKAAYDWIDRDILFKIVEYRTNSPLLTKLLKCMYIGTTAAIQSSQSVFETLSGCRQGGLESPCLFNIFLDFVLRCAFHKIKQVFTDPGIRIEYTIPSQCSTRSQRMEHRLSGNTYITHICYADDIVFFCKSRDDLQKTLDILDVEFRRFGLIISPTKTKAMSFNINDNSLISNVPITLNAAPIEDVSKFPYLGHSISSESNDHSSLIIQRIASAFSKFNDLKHVLTDRRIRLKTRVKFLTACVRSRLTFSVQACLLNAAEVTKLESVWMNFLRKLVRNGFQRVNVPLSRRRASRRSRRRSETSQEPPVDEEDLDWRFRYNSDAILHLTNSDPIQMFCQTQHLKYIAHVTRLPNSSIQKQVFFRTNKKPYVRDPWLRYEEITSLSKLQLQREMQDKQRFLSLLERILGAQNAETAIRERR